MMMMLIRKAPVFEQIRDPLQIMQIMELNSPLSGL